MLKNGAAGSSTAFQIRSVRQIRDDLAVASINFGPVTAHGVWITDIGGSPQVSWPRSNKGWPALTVADGVRDQVETALLDVVAGWRSA